MLQASEKSVKIETNPPGAKVLVNGLFVGDAPCVYVAPRRRGQFEFEVLPPANSTGGLWTQHRSFTWDQIPVEGATLYFDLRLEPSRPVETIEVR